jgi:isochorismate hydrolase
MNGGLPRSPLLLSAAESLLLIIDVQDKFLSLLPDRAQLLANVKRLVLAARILDVPRRATEQYPEKMGPTTDSLLELLDPDVDAPAKLSFSCGGCETAVAQLRAVDRRQIVVAGLETHVCVAQTVFDLIAAGFDVYPVADAVGARHTIDHDVALRRMESSGATLVTTEAVLFEWCQQAGTPQFKQVSQLLRRSGAVDP